MRPCPPLNPPRASTLTATSSPPASAAAPGRSRRLSSSRAEVPHSPHECEGRGNGRVDGASALHWQVQLYVMSEGWVIRAVFDHSSAAMGRDLGSTFRLTRRMNSTEWCQKEKGHGARKKGHQGHYAARRGGMLAGAIRRFAAEVNCFSASSPTAFVPSCSLRRGCHLRRC